MSSTNNYNTYRPTKLKVSRFGVNLSDATNEDLSLNSSQYMVVGERLVNQNGITSNVYSLMVDDEGLAVNMTMAQRDANKLDYPTQLSGSLYVDGNIILTGVVVGDTSNIIGGSSNFWRYASSNNIYHNGKVNIGDFGDAENNTYSFNIVEPANRDIDKAQFSIQNGQLSEIRTAILGNASNSPVIFNTAKDSPIEFHINRDTEYFYNTYNEIYWDTLEGQSNIRTVDIPVYGGACNSPYPNLIIDENGNVGINTNISQGYGYIQRKPNTENSNIIEYSSNYDSMKLYVSGALYATDMLMYDYESGIPKSLDDLYVRALGQTIEACNIIPGEFPQGIFTFNSNVSILTTDTSEALNIGGNINCEGDIVCDNIFANNNGSFSNNIIQNNVYFKGNLFTQVNSNGELIWEPILYSSNTLISSGISNIFDFAYGAATSGRFGAGIYPSGTCNDEVNHQMVIRKRDSTIYELELMDRSSPYINKTAWIGHPNVSSDKIRDASLTFVTPSSTNPNFNLFYPYTEQNIYFFPGYENYASTFVLTSNTIPTLGIFESNKVGIRKYNPETELDIHGDIQFDGSIYYKYDSSFDPYKLAIWKSKEYSLITSGPGTFNGIEYSETTAPHVGINTIANELYGLDVKGKLRSIDGYFTNDGYQLMPWYNTLLDEGVSLPNEQLMFTIGKVGIGMRRPDTTLHVMDSSSSTNLKLSQSGFTSSTILQMAGNTNNYMFHLNDSQNMLELYYGSSNDIYTSTSNRPFITTNNETSHRIVINSNISILDDTTETLIVNGNVKVYGDVDVTGQYKISGNAITITNSNAEYDLNLTNTQDILIAGTDIFINPDQNNNKRLYIGYTNTDYINYGTDKPAVLNVIQQIDTQDKYIARYTSIGDNAIIRMKSDGVGKTVDLGITDNTHFSIFRQGRLNYPYISCVDNDRVGFGTTSTINNSLVNIFANTQKDMFRITRYNGTDGTDITPNLTLNKRISTNNYDWTFAGPNSIYNQKLQLSYNTTALGSTELFTFTSNGCLGIGNTTPEFALDIKSSGDIGCIRMYQTNSSIAKPQLIFQSGSNVYGVDDSADFRMYSSNNNFDLDMQFLGTRRNLLNFTSNGSLGIRQLADPLYDVSIDGTLNVSDKIYINGNEVFATTFGTGTTTITSENIVLMPDTSKYGGVSINYNGGTSNILYVKSGYDGNMLVLDSDYNEAQINFRVKEDISNDRLFRLAASNQSFILEYSSNDLYGDSPPTFSDSHDGYIQALNITHDGTEFNATLNANLSLTSNSVSIDTPNSTQGDPALYVNGISVFTNDVYVETLNVADSIINASDKRVKYDIEPIENALHKIKQLSGYTFSKINNDKRLTGVIAQEVEKVIPEAVFTGKDDIMGVDYGSLMGLMIEGIKELSSQLDDIKKRLE